MWKNILFLKTGLILLKNILKPQYSLNIKWKCNIQNYIHDCIVNQYTLTHFIYLNKFEYPSPKDLLCQVCLRLAQWFLKNDFLNVIIVYFCHYLHLEKKVSFFKLEFHSLKYCFVPNLVEIYPLVLEKRNFERHRCIFAILS